jgi:hypothetical protein
MYLKIKDGYFCCRKLKSQSKQEKYNTKLGYCLNLEGKEEIILLIV